MLLVRTHALAALAALAARHDGPSVARSSLTGSSFAVDFTALSAAQVDAYSDEEPATVRMPVASVASGEVCS